MGAKPERGQKRQRKGETLGETERGRDKDEKKINTSEMAAMEGKRSQITRANTLCANNVCVRVCACVDVESRVIATRLITTHTLANGDKVSNLVHNMSLAHFKANGDILWLYAYGLSKHWRNALRNNICDLHKLC